MKRSRGLLIAILWPTLVFSSPDVPECAKAKGAALAKCRSRIMSDALREQLKRNLKDPYSAVFTDEGLYRSDDPEAFALCGRVNAKNSYGGFTGVSGFISTTTGLVRLEHDQPSAFGDLRAMFCSQPAVNMSPPK